MRATIGKLTLSAAVWCGVALAATAQEPAQPAKAGAPNYNEHVVPILRKYCVGCHDAESAEGGLVLDSFDKLMRGGRNGAAVSPGSSERSRLFRLVTGASEPKMPPKESEAPNAAEVALLGRWIDAGAKGPSGAEPPPGLIAPHIKPKAAPRQPVQSLAVSPDGKLLAIGGFQQVLIVDRATSVLLKTLKGHAGAVNSVAFTKDSAKLLAAGGEPGLFGEAKLWSVADGQLLKTFTGHTDSLYTAELSPDEKILATGSYDKLVLLWDAASGKETAVLKGHNGAVYSLAFSPDGAKLVTASADATAKLWNVADGSRLETFGQSLKGLYSTLYTPDGRRVVAAGSDNRIRIWEISSTAAEGTNPLLYSRFAHQAPIVELAVTKAGDLLASAAEDRTVKIWDGATFIEKLAIETQPDWPTALAFSPDGKSLYIGRIDGSLALYDAATGSKQADVKPLPPKPELASVSLRGLQRGATTTLKLVGKNFADLSGAEFNRPGATAKLVERSPEGVAPEWATVEVALTPETATGAIEMAAVGPGGKSATLKLFVDDLPQQAEAPGPDDAAHAALVTVPHGVWGVLANQGDVDLYNVSAKVNQTLVFDASAQSLGFKGDLVLRLLDAQGRVLAIANDDGAALDPLLAHTFAADGQYTIEVGDAQIAGSKDHTYRLTITDRPYAVGVYPPGVPSGKETTVAVVGWNLPVEATAKIPASPVGMLDAPLDANVYRFRTRPKVVIGEANETQEAEPNDAPEQATVVAAPVVVDGRIAASQDVDLYRFHATAGQQWIIETDAARRGSPIDTAIEIRDASGKPVPRVLLQATRDSYITFRGIDSKILDVRVKSWEEMELNDYLYMQGEVGKFFRLPQGPDSGFQFYGRNNVRLNYFDSSPTTHALDDPCYIVTPHPPGTKLVPNGLPEFVVNYANDDSADRKLGVDSRLTFTAPADGDYLVRVVDTRGLGWDASSYRLVIRQPKPDFTVRLEGANPTISATSGKNVRLVADRTDGFDGDIVVHLTGLPPGFQVTSPIVIQSGHDIANAVIWATPDAPAPTPENESKAVVSAAANINGQEVTHEVNSLGKIALGPKPKIVVRIEPSDVVLQPGQTLAATLKVERNGFTGPISFNVPNLPHGVFVDNIGLNGVLIPDGQSERQLWLTARKWVPETNRPFFAEATADGAQSSPGVMLRVQKAATVAAAAAAKDVTPPTNGTK